MNGSACSNEAVLFPLSNVVDYKSLLGAFKQLDEIKKTFAYRIKSFVQVENGSRNFLLSVFNGLHTDIPTNIVCLLKSDRSYPDFSDFYFVPAPSLTLARRKSIYKDVFKPLMLNRVSMLAKAWAFWYDVFGTDVPRT